MDWFKISYITILTIYTVFIAWNIFILLFLKKKSIDLENYNPSTLISIIIPARNEEQNILKCLEGISLQNFPKNLLQIIVVDDGSSDKTSLVAEKFLKENFTHYQLLSLNNKETETQPSIPSREGTGKKNAILKAIEHATGKIIITRDADTFTNSHLWLKSIVHHFETSDCDLLLSPVILTSPLFSRGESHAVKNGDREVGNSFLSTFQQFENLSISSLGMGMAKSRLPFVCSGANLAYKKEAFLQIQPYNNNLHIASGDDMFLLKYFYLNKRKIEANVSNQAIVYTPAENSLKKMLSQRLRWASKSIKINTAPVFFTGLLVLFTNTLSLPALCLGFFNGYYLTFSLFTLTLKFIIDFLLLFLSARMFKQKVNWPWLPLAFLFNSLYVPVLAFASFFVKPKWKSRKINV